MNVRDLREALAEMNPEAPVFFQLGPGQYQLVTGTRKFTSAGDCWADQYPGAVVGKREGDPLLDAVALTNQRTQ